ncbi:DUF2787 family protein [Shewanella algae]|uniref:DUF2787 family protein n=1 Tax=Shewanella algae TaxID=38313 RepID=UPI0011830FE9|nr:DUF2787 family protein [Shewanella algae]TVL16333.1 hypothetical protein AYJ02_06930 [Shewanella algae]
MNTIIRKIVLPVSERMLNALEQRISNTIGSVITISFKDPNYSPSKGGFHPVEIRLERQGEYLRLSYITDFCYVGMGDSWELAKELDFDFDCKVFQNMVGVYSIKSAVEIYQVWESNFLSYWLEMDVFTVTISPE